LLRRPAIGRQRSILVLSRIPGKLIPVMPLSPGAMRRRNSNHRLRKKLVLR